LLCGDLLQPLTFESSRSAGTNTSGEHPITTLEIALETTWPALAKDQLNKQKILNTALATKIRSLPVTHSFRHE